METSTIPQSADSGGRNKKYIYIYNSKNVCESGRKGERKSERKSERERVIGGREGR